MSSDTSSTLRSDQDEEQNSSSLLAILDDKNRIISMLQDQLHNQQAQLMFYIQKRLNNEKIKKYSQTCLVDAGDDNIGLSMELVNFCKQNGLPSKLKNMYSRMLATEKKMRSVMKLQDKVLKMILTKLIKAKMENPESSQYFQQAPGEFSLFYSMYQLDSQLHKELRNFRICCNKLIIIEDERNSLAEQVCSLPVDEKFERKSLIVLNDEKLILEAEINELKQEKKMLLEEQSKYEDIPETSYENLDSMLEVVNDEAAKLLQSALQQKESYQNELKKLTLENDALKCKLRKMMTIINSKEEIEQKIKNVEEVCVQSVKETVSTQRKERMKWTRDMRMLKKKLESVTLEKNSCKRKLAKLKEKVENQIKEQFEKTIEEITKERDVYKVKHERLVYIQASYKDVVEQNMKLKELECADKKDLEEINVRYNNLVCKLDKQCGITDFLQKQIKTLLIIIYILGKNTSIPMKEAGDHVVENQAENSETVAEPDQSCKCLMDKIDESEVWRTNVCNAYPNCLVETISKSVSLKNDSEIEAFKVVQRKTKHKVAKSTPALEKLQQIISQYGDFMRKTREVKSEPKTFEVSSVHSNESISDESRMTENESKNVSFASETKHFNSETSTTLDSQFETAKPSRRESELMRDCSNESLQQFYQSMNRRAAETQIGPESIVKLTLETSKETSMSKANVSNNLTQTNNHFADKTTSSSVHTLDKAVSSAEYQKDVSTNVSGMKSEMGCTKSRDSSNDSSGFLDANASLPKTPLECLIEKETFPAHILQISESDLVEKLCTMSSKLDELTENQNSNELSMIDNIRCVFDTLFSSSSVYASE